MKNTSGFTHWVIVILISIIAVGLVGAAWWYEENKESITTKSNTNQAMYSQSGLTIFTKTYDATGAKDIRDSVNHKTTSTRKFNDIKWSNQIIEKVSFEYSGSVAPLPQLDKKNIIMDSIFYNPDKDEITYIETFDNENDQLIKQGLQSRKIIKTINLPQENTKRYSEFPNGKYIFTNLDEQKIKIVDADLQNEMNFSIDIPFTSTFWTPDLNYILFTTNENEGTYKSNIYSYRIDNGVITNFTNDGDTYLKHKFNIHNETDSRECEYYDKNQTNWQHGYKFFSPDNKYLLTDNCEGLLIFDLSNQSVNRIIQNNGVYSIGWLDNDTILVRIKNNTNDYRILYIDIQTGVEKRFIKENLYWDVFWSISPAHDQVYFGDHNRDVIYAVKSFLTETCWNCPAPSGVLVDPDNFDVYFISFGTFLDTFKYINFSRNKFLSEYPLRLEYYTSGARIKMWSSDGQNIMIITQPDYQGFDPPKTACNVFNITGGYLTGKKIGEFVYCEDAVFAE